MFIKPLIFQRFCCLVRRIAYSVDGIPIARGQFLYPAELKPVLAREILFA